MKVLLVTGSEDLSQTIPIILKVRWPELSLVHTMEAREGIELMYREQPDIILLHLPDRSEGSASLDCFDLISQIRGFDNVPIIVLSQSDDVVDKVRALETGADDWICPTCMPMPFFAAALPAAVAVSPVSSMAGYL